MVSIGIVVPTWHYFANPFKLQPLNELYFATVIDSRFQRKVKVKVIDFRQSRLDNNKSSWESIKTCLSEHDLYFYWVAKTADYLEVVGIVEKIKQLYPQARHVAGGTHIDNFPKESKPHFDAIVVGPGEESFITAINDYSRLSLRPEYKSDWKQVKYDNYPFARRHYLPERAILNRELFSKYGQVLGTSAMFSRGCNFKCAYCVYNVPNKIQRRSDQAVAQEINYLKKEYRIEGVNLRDEICIPPARKIAVPFLETMGKMNIMWRGQTRLGADKEIIKIAAGAGCVELALGLESVSQQVLDVVKKKQSVQKARDFIKVCQSFGIKIKMCLILGLPGEPRNIVSLTKLFVEETQPDYVNISGFCPVPGSDVFRNFKEYGIKYIDRDWSKHAHLLFRFSDEEHFGLPFEYEERSKWGKNFSREEIVNNIKDLQHHFKELGMSY